MNATQAGAARALADVLRRRRPDLAWEVTLGPLSRSEDSTSASPGEIRRLITRSDDADPSLERPSSLSHPHDRKRAA